MTRKNVTLFLLVFIMLAMTACGNSKKSETTGQTESVSNLSEQQTAETVETTDARVADTENAEEAESGNAVAEPADNMFSLCYDSDNARSAVITFNSEKAEIISLSYNGAEFELIDDYSKTLLLMCEYKNPSLQDLYDKKMGQYFENEEFTVSELTETQLCGLNGWYCDAVWENADSAYEMFVIELSNGMLLYTKHFQGFDEDKISLEELLSDILVDVTEGDGTRIKPALSYDFDINGDVMTMTFASGENFTFDYDQDIVDVYNSGISIRTNFLDLEDSYGISLDLTNNFADASEFFEYHRNYGLESVSEFSGDGQNFTGISVGRYDDGTVLCYVDFGNGYALWSEYRAEENAGRDVEEMLTALVGTLEVVQTQGEAATTENISTWFDYVAPTELGDSTESMVYQMNGVLYRFPTPAAAFLANGWSFLQLEGHEMFTIPAHGYCEPFMQDANGNVIMVDVRNDTDEEIPIEEGLVTWMQVDNYQIDLVIPGLYVDDTPASVFYLHYNVNAYETLVERAPGEPVFDDGYRIFSWYGEDGRSELAVTCRGIDWTSQVKMVVFNYE